MTRYRRGRAGDSRRVFDIFEAAIDDLGRRTGGGANQEPTLSFACLRKQ